MKLAMLIGVCTAVDRALPAVPQEVPELALSQEGKLQNHSTQQQIAWQSSIILGFFS